MKKGEKMVKIYSYLELQNMLEVIVKLRQQRGAKDRFVIAIDGNCGSGKSTGCLQVSDALGCEVVHMDDFYLTPQMRTREREEEPGGNVDYERFSKEVVPYLKKREPFSYGKYDCDVDSIIKQVQIKNPDIVLVEGAYSMRPEFRDCYDLKIFSSISKPLQLKRLEQREGAEGVKDYENIWIPLENRYIAYYDLVPACDIIIYVG